MAGRGRSASSGFQVYGPPTGKPFKRQNANQDQNASSDFEALNRKFEDNQRKNEEREFLKRLRIAEARAEKAEEDARHAQELVREAMEFARNANEKVKLAEARATEAEKGLKEAQAQNASVWSVATLKEKLENVLKSEVTSNPEAVKTQDSVAVQTSDELNHYYGKRKLKTATARADSAEAKLQVEKNLRLQAEEAVTALQNQIQETDTKHLAEIHDLRNTDEGKQFRINELEMRTNDLEIAMENCVTCKSNYVHGTYDHLARRWLI